MIAVCDRDSLCDSLLSIFDTCHLLDFSHHCFSLRRASPYPDACSVPSFYDEFSRSATRCGFSSLMCAAFALCVLVSQLAYHWRSKVYDFVWPVVSRSQLRREPFHRFGQMMLLCPHCVAIFEWCQWFPAYAFDSHGSIPCMMNAGVYPVDSCTLVFTASCSSGHVSSHVLRLRTGLSSFSRLYSLSPWDSVARSYPQLLQQVLECSVRELHSVVRDHQLRYSVFRQYPFPNSVLQCFQVRASHRDYLGPLRESV